MLTDQKVSRPAKDKKMTRLPTTTLFYKGAAWLVLIVFMSLSVWLGQYEKTSDLKSSQARFDNRVYDIQSRLERRMTAYESLLRGGAGLFGASKTVERDEWRRYVRSLDIEHGFRGIQGIGFSLRLAADEKDRHISQVRQEGFPDYAITPQGERGEYTSIVYLEPFTGRNLSAFGYDMFSEPVRRAAMEQARDTGAAAVSGKVKLVQESGQDIQSGFLMYYPVYRNGQPHDTVEQRRAALMGYVYSPFRMNDLIGGIIGTKIPDLDIELYDGSTTSPSALMYDSKAAPIPSPDFSSETRLNFYGHRWLMNVNSLPAFATANNTQHPTMILVSGAVISLLLFALIWNMATTRERALARAREITRELGTSESRATRLNRALQMLSDCNQVLVRTADEQQLLADICRIIVEKGGYRLAWVGFAEQDQAKSVRCVAHAGYEQDYLDNLTNISWAETEHGRGPTGCVIRNGTSYICQNILTDVGMAPWREAAFRHGIQSLIALPLICNNKNILGSLSIYASGSDAFGAEELKLLEELANDLSFGISTLRSNAVRMQVEERLKLVLDTANEGIWDADLKTGIVYRSPCYYEMLGYQSDEVTPDMAFFKRIVHPDDLPQVLESFAAHQRGETSHTESEFRMITRSGQAIWVLEKGRLVERDTGGEPLRIVGTIADITQRKLTELRLVNNEHHLRQAQAQAHLGSWRLDIQSNALFWSEENYRIFGQPQGMPLTYEIFISCVHPEDREYVDCAWQAALNGEPYDIQHRLLVDGRIKWVRERAELEFAPDGSLLAGVGTTQDITDRKNYEAQLEKLANHDALTGLANRNLLGDRMEQSIAHAHRAGLWIATMLLDLDRFKLINDSLGHAAGDALLQEVAKRLSQCVRPGDTVARLGGDEFMVVMADMASENDAAILVRNLLNVVMQPIMAAGHEVIITASIGVSVYPRDGEVSSILFQNADVAMYRAKELGRNGFQFYAPEMNTRMLERLELEYELRRALERGELELHYQPQVNLAHGHVVGAEALIRWNHPVAGRISPADFIPLAEETGLIVPIGEWIIDEACRQLKAWQNQGYPNITVAVNLSARQFQQENLADVVAQALRVNGVQAQYLELEVTESAIMVNPEKTIAILGDMKKIGVHISLDDFGTGYSSLNYLKRFPIDSLKIDQSFVRDITSDPDDAAIARMVIALAHSLKQKVIAEGVETEAQLKFLQQQRCDEMQGYFFSRPLPAEAFAALLQGGRRLEPGVDTSEALRTLLIVDDEANVISSIKRLLRTENYRILTASNAAEGMNLLALHPIQVVISDQRMPQINGSEFLSRVWKMYPDTIRILLTGYTDLESVTQAVNRGAILKFLTKPWEDDQLKEHIREAFRYYASKDTSDV